MKVLVTGAAGFIGSHIAARFPDVVGVDNLSTGRRSNFDGELVECDIADGLPDVRADLIYHCAGSYRHTDAEADARTNVMGTINVVRLARRTGAKIVYLQTSLCYGRRDGRPSSVDAPLAPVGSYAVSKTAGEAYVRDGGTDWVSLRLANIYGPRAVMGPIPVFWKRLNEGQPCRVVDSRRDFLYVDDLVDLALIAGDRGHGVYHAATGRDLAMRDVYIGVAAAMGLAVEEPVLEPRHELDAPTILIDPSATLAALAWRASTPFSVGITRAVAWYAEHGVERTYTHLELLEGSTA